MTSPKTTITKNKHGTPVIGVAGWKNSGKTTLTVRLVEAFVRRGYKVATVKHAHHSFRIDDEATDSARHRRAGAGQVAIVSSERMALVTEYAERGEPDFPDVIDMLGPCDLIVVEGYKTAPIFKVEARRGASLTKQPLAATDPNVIAIAADHAVVDAGAVPVFGLDDVEGIADLVVGRLGLGGSFR